MTVARNVALDRFIFMIFTDLSLHRIHIPPGQDAVSSNIEYVNFEICFHVNKK